MKLGPERGSLGRWLGLGYGALAAAAVVAAGAGLPLATRPCVLLERTGVACPTCGGTRALAALARGDLLGAMVQHPLISAAVIALAGWFLAAAIATLVPRWRRRIVLGPREVRGARIGGLALIIGTWIYQIVRHLDRFSGLESP